MSKRWAQSIVVISSCIFGLVCSLPSNNTSADNPRRHECSGDGLLGCERDTNALPTVQIRASMGGHVIVSNLFTPGEELALRAAACALGGTSMLAGFVISYWFYMMKRVFRHRLIFMLLISDIARSSWTFVFATVSIARGGVDTRSSFCQAGGFFLQGSFVTADWAILFIAIHTAVQVFRPEQLFSGQGGIYRYRHAIFTIMVVAPSFTASLAFINKSGGYVMQGPACSLPRRPFWYRLALTWIPRYLIIACVIVLYICIYVHAELQLTDTRLFRGRFSMAVARRMSGRDNMRKEKESKSSTTPGAARQGSLEAEFQEYTHTQDDVLDEVHAGRHLSGGTTLVDAESARHPSAITACGSRNSTMQDAIEAEKLRSVPEEAPNAAPVQANNSIEAAEGHENGSGQGVGEASTNSSNVEGRLEIRLMQKKHDAIRRQLRLQFVYPIVYFLAWLVPFANHVTQYSAKRAQQPIFGLVIATTVCQAGMGLLDFVVFSIREQPWRHIPGSDRTFVGSFAFWRRKSIVESQLSYDTSPMSTHHDKSRSIDRTLSAPRKFSAFSRARHAFTGSKKAPSPEERSSTLPSLDPPPSRANGGADAARLTEMESWDFVRGSTTAEGRD